MPDGFAPEGVVMGHGAELFAGSLASGAIYRADLRTGQGEVVVTPPEGRTAVGLAFDERSGLVYAAGGGTGGELYRVHPATGEASLVDLGSDSVPSGDGILLQDHSLYVVQNSLNQITVVELAPDLLTGDVTNTISDPAFRIPTTVATFGSYLYAVNARFNTPAAPDVEYEVVQIGK